MRRIPRTMRQRRVITAKEVFVPTSARATKRTATSANSTTTKTTGYPQAPQTESGALSSTATPHQTRPARHRSSLTKFVSTPKALKTKSLLTKRKERKTLEEVEAGAVAEAEAAVEAEVVAEVETAAIHANRTFASEHRPPTGPKSPQEAVHFHMRTR
jgi:hypothetical protein